MLTKEQVKSSVHIKSMLPFAELFRAEKNTEALDSIFEKSHNLWIENLNKIKGKVNYIMFCEAPPFDANGEVSNYIYDREGEAKGMYLKASYKALKVVVDKYPSKAEMIDYLNSRGFLFIDLLPLSINYTNKRGSEKYKKLLQYFWNGKGSNYNMNYFITQSRLEHLDFKINQEVKVSFALKSTYNILNKLEDSNLYLGSKTICISNKDIIGVDNSNFPNWKKIRESFTHNVTN